MNHLIAIHDQNGQTILYDMYENGVWIGSRRTLTHCLDVLGSWLYVVGVDAS